jgi:hypothetical protein
MVGVRRFARPVGVRRVATGDWPQTLVRAVGKWRSQRCLGVRALWGPRRGDARRRRGQRTLDATMQNRFSLACFDRVFLQKVELKCTKV